MRLGVIPLLTIWDPHMYITCRLSQKEIYAR